MFYLITTKHSLISALYRDRRKILQDRLKILILSRFGNLLYQNLKSRYLQWKSKSFVGILQILANISVQCLGGLGILRRARGNGCKLNRSAAILGVKIDSSFWLKEILWKPYFTANKIDEWHCNGIRSAARFSQKFSYGLRCPICSADDAGMDDRPNSQIRKKHHACSKGNLDCRGAVNCE